MTLCSRFLVRLVLARLGCAFGSLGVLLLVAYSSGLRITAAQAQSAAAASWSQGSQVERPKAQPLPSAPASAGGTPRATPPGRDFAASRDGSEQGDARSVTFLTFLADLEAQLDRLPRHPALAAEHLALCTRHRIEGPECEALSESFYRTRLLFEATRDGGLWRLRWAVTNQEPSSRRIWTQWSQRTSFFGAASATAECDEISSLFAFLSREVGVRSVGLFYPTWNHTIAAFSPAEIHDVKQRRAIRILIPTTQIFLSCEAGFDRTTFEEKKQPVFEYPLHDLSAKSRIPRPVAEFLLDQLAVYGGSSPDLLDLLRLHRAERFRSSVGDCSDQRRTLVQRLRVDGITEADAAAIRHYFEHELGMPGGEEPEQALSTLAGPTGAP